MGENKGKGDEKEKKPSESQKEKNGGGSEKKKEGGGGGGGGGAEKKEEGPPKIVLKVDMHCEGCASKIKRWTKGFEGVEGVTLDMANNKLTVIGSADPWKLREHLEAKSRKKVEIVSPVNPPKKEADGGKKAAETDGKKPANGQKKEAAGDSKDKQKADDKKSKEPVASTVVLRIRLHCDGCIQRIKKNIFRVKGVQDVSVDAQKDLVTVKGTMDVNSLPSYLKEKLNRGVEIVSATTAGGSGGGGGGGEKKEKPVAAATGGGGGGEKKDKGGSGGGEKKGNGGGGGGEKKGNGGGGGGGEKKGKDGGGDGGKKEEHAEATAAAPAPVVEANRMEYYGGPYGGYRAEMLHAPQLFSDENPNACSVM